MKHTPDWLNLLLTSNLDLISKARRLMTANRGKTTNASVSIILSACNPTYINTKRSTHFCTPFDGDGDLPIESRVLYDSADARKIQNPPRDWQARCLISTVPMTRMISS